MPFWLRVSIGLLAKTALIVGVLLLFSVVSYWLVLALYYSAWFGQWTALPMFAIFIFWLVGSVLGVGWAWKAIGYFLDRVDEAIWRRYDRRVQ